MDRLSEIISKYKIKYIFCGWFGFKLFGGA